MYNMKNLWRRIGRIQIALLVLLGLMAGTLQGEEANKNIVLAAAESWGTYTPANFWKGWPRLTYKADISQRGYGDPASSIFYTSRMVTSGQFGNPGFGWLEGFYIADFTNFMTAVEYNPTDEFANLNASVHSESPHYAWLSYSDDVPGADDPTRNYHIPEEGGQVLSADGSYAYGVSAWPTQLGVDVKLTVHSWTTPYAHMDDFQLVEMEFYNTGEADIDGDGTVDISNNRIHTLTLNYNPTVFGFRINNGGGRSYWKPNSRFRGYGLDLTRDANEAPWNIGFQGFGSDIGSPGGFPGYGYSNGANYKDNYVGYTYLGAKTYDENTGTWVDETLAFKDANGNETVPTVGTGAQRGWFMTHQPGYNSVNDGTPKGVHTSAMGAFYVDGGKNIDKSSFDLNPNPNLFSGGTDGDPTSFVVKDPAQWAYPDGAYEFAPATDVTDRGQNWGKNPLSERAIQNKGELEPGIITRGFISEYWFDGSPVSGFGPIALEVGDRVKVFFVRGVSFRMDTGPNDTHYKDRTLGLRKTMKAARAVYKSMEAGSPEKSLTQFTVPETPPVPEIRIDASPEVVPIVKWQDPAGVGDYDGIKIYKSVAWPRYNPLYDGTPMHDVWWQTMTPGEEPDPVPYNPLFVQEEIDARISTLQGMHWGPYHLVKVIDKADIGEYASTFNDAGTYPYAWVDETYTSPGQSYWYYVSTFKNNPTIPAAFQGIENPGVNWSESGKVNFNGRSGHWEDTWPHSENHSWFPSPENAEKRKALGARFTLVPPTSNNADIAMGRVDIGVRPNPYKRTAFHDTGSDHNIMFYNLPSQCTISIFDLSGMLIDQIDFIAPTEDQGSYFWDMYSKGGNEIASGLYIWVVEYENGKEMGKFAIIR